MKIILLGLVLELVLVACGTQSKTPPVAEPETGVKEIRVRGGDFWLEPSSVTVNKGDQVKIIFENAGTVVHNLDIDGYGSTDTIFPGSTDSIEFVADKAGTIAMWCAVQGHRAAGMEGVFVVE